LFLEIIFKSYSAPLLKISTTSRGVQIRFDEIKYLSDPVAGYSYSPFCSNDYYRIFLNDLKKMLNQDGCVYSLLSNHPSYFEHCKRFEGWKQEFSKLQNVGKDISALVHHQRRIKDSGEIALIQKAVDITIEAQRKAEKSIEKGKFEFEVQLGENHYTILNLENKVTLVTDGIVHINIMGNIFDEIDIELKVVN